MKTFQLNTSFLLIATTAFLLSACGSLEQEIDLSLPDHERQLNVECYIIPELPIYFLSLTETVGFFEEFDIPTVSDAVVTIQYMGQTDTLQNVNLSDGFPLPGGDTIRLFIPGAQELYVGFRTAPNNFDSTFTLTIIDEKRSRKATAVTKMMPIIGLDGMEAQFNDEGEAFVLSKFTDPPGVDNYYRRILKHKVPLLLEPDTIRDNMGQIISITGDTVWVNEIDQEFTFDDQLQDGQEILLGTDFNYVAGDTVISFLYHIEKSYYDYLVSTDGAIIANLSPFAQPTRILTNIEGGTGIFTGVAISVDTLVVR